MIVPYQRLSPEALAAVIEEYVSRDGTEQTETSVKSEQVKRALEVGELVLVFDAETESCNLLPPDEAKERLEVRDTTIDPDFETP